MRALYILLLMGTISCGPDDESTSSTVSGSCLLTTNDETNMCLEYNQVSGTVFAAARQSCDENEDLTATWSTNLCSSTDVVGSCSISSEGSTYQAHYYQNYFTAQTAEEACDNAEGTYSAALR